MPDDRRVIDVTAVVAGGDGLGRDDDGRVTFITGALPGERVEVVVTEERRDFARGEIERIEVRVADRCDPPCPFVAAGCGGCGWQHVTPSAQVRFKRDLVVDALIRIGRLEAPPVAEGVALDPFGYRTTVRVAVDPNGRPAFRMASSHDLVTVDACLVSHPLINDILKDAHWPGAREASFDAALAPARRWLTCARVPRASNGPRTSTKKLVVDGGASRRVPSSRFGLTAPTPSPHS